jgi:7-keto-8-aminopelargonate synthetase-like enzyme
MSPDPRNIDVVDAVISEAVDRGLLHLATEDVQLDGRSVRMRGREVLHFASCSYLGLEFDPRLRAGVVEAVQRYGTQFSSSRAYLSAPPYQELESALERIFEAPALVAPSTTLAHLSAIPVLVQPGDAVLLDHQAHQSVQLAAAQVRLEGVPVELVRHARIDKLEDAIRRLGRSHGRIWYLGDGVYSMYGDFAPVKGLTWLLANYEKLHLYVDDAHGMSWLGRRGCGFAAESFAGHERVVISVSLNKAFAAAGAALVFPTPEMKRKVWNCGPTLMFGGPIQPPMLGAAIASARIHLSPEIQTLQAELRERILFANQLAARLELPLVSSAEVPIRYLGLGLKACALEMGDRLLQRGIYVTPAGYPAVSARRAGVRLMLTRHHTLEDIRSALEAAAEVLPAALAAGPISREMIQRSFGLEAKSVRAAPRPRETHGELSLSHLRTVRSLDPAEWDACLGGRGIFDAATLGALEEIFGANQSPESCWSFHYFIVRDGSGRVVLATFFTEALWKDDLLATSLVSEEVERQRAHDPYFLTSRTLSMGSLLTEGNHLFLDRSADWRGALRLLLTALEEVREESGAQTVVLRDLAADDAELAGIVGDADYLRLPAPDSWVTEIEWRGEEDFLNRLASRERRFHRRQVLPFDKTWDVEVAKAGTPELAAIDWAHLYSLYRNVQERQLALNTFPIPQEFLPRMLATPGWELLMLRLRRESGGRVGGLPQGFVACRAGRDRYDWLLVGMDYDYVESHGLYRQLVANVVRRAEHLGLSRVGLGIGAERVKRRFRARPEKRVMYVQSFDRLHHDVLFLIESSAHLKRR